MTNHNRKFAYVRILIYLCHAKKERDGIGQQCSKTLTGHRAQTEFAKKVTLRYVPQYSWLFRNKAFDTVLLTHPLTADKWAYTLDTEQHYLPSNGYILTSEDLPIRYILGLLNSKVLHHYFSYIGIMTAGGAYTLKATTIEALPIPDATHEQQQSIIALVDNILAIKRQNPSSDVTSLEAQIDKSVYKLYKLTDDEIKIVEEG